MALHSGDGVYHRLRQRCLPAWLGYTEHDFVNQLGEGTLPTAAFQDYLVQDYLFLVQFARANALAAYKSRTLAEIQGSADALSAILAETELHVRLTERWGISREELEATPEKQATVAYTRYVLDCGMTGDLLDLNVALAPCTIGYAEIGERLARQYAPGADHPYREWIEEYAGAEFQGAARAAIARLDELAGGELSERRMRELEGVFATATRLESEFWQQAL